MNKANQTTKKYLMLCPFCGTKGKPVKAITIESLLTDEVLKHVSSKVGFRFCSTPNCEVSYFHSETGERFDLADINVRIGQKETEAPRPVCYCFNHTVEEIETEVAQTGTSKIPDAITEKCRAGLDRCEQTNPQGSCCLGNVRQALKNAQEKFGWTANRLPTTENAESQPLSDCCAATTPAPEPYHARANREGLWATSGAVLSAVLSSACCWLPLLLIAFGVSAASVAGFFETYRPLLLGVTGILLASGFYFVYFRKERCTPDSVCATPNLRLKRLNKSMLWVATAVVLAFALFPNYLGILLGRSPTNKAAAVTLNGPSRLYQIEGMTCSGCAANLQSQLAKLPGIAQAQVSYEDKTAQVYFEADKATPADEKILNAIADVGFHGWRVKSVQ